MQAIRTRYYGPTNFKGSKIIAKCEAGQITMGYRSELDLEENHKAACELLLEKLGWNTDKYSSMVGGEFDNDFFWVFSDEYTKTGANK